MSFVEKRMSRISLLLAAVLVMLIQTAVSGAPGHSRSVSELKFSPDGSVLASGAYDADVKIWDAADGKLRRTLSGHRLMISELAFSADGEKLVTASWDGMVMVWEVASGKRVLGVDAGKGPAYAAALSPDGELLATGGNEKVLRLWNAKTGELMHEHQLVEPIPGSMTFSPDGETLAVGTRRGTVILWDVGKWQRRETISDVGGWVRQLAYESSGKHLMTVSNRLARWQLDPIKAVAQCKKKRFRGGGYSSDGSVLVGVRGHRAWVWKGWDDAKLNTIRHKKGDLVSAAVSPDGDMIVLGDVRGRITALNPADGEEIYATSPAPLPDGAEEPLRQPRELTGKNLLAHDAHRYWRVHWPSRALRWVEDEAGVRFRAAAIPTHMAARDYMETKIALEDNPFELTWDVKIDKLGGPGFFMSGLAFGVASDSPGVMSRDNDMAVVFGVHFNGIFAGATRGDPYGLKPPHYSQIATKPLTSLFGGGKRGRLGYTREVRGIIATDKVMRCRLSRDARDVLTYTVWCPSAGQTAAEPWWRGTWEMPDKWMDTKLNHLFIKRTPIPGVHTGWQQTGYGTGIEMRGRVSRLNLALNPPAIESVGQDEAVLKTGSKIVVRGTGFSKGVEVRIGGEESPEVKRISAKELKVTIPALVPGARYSLTTVNPGGASASLSDAVPVGRILENSSLVQVEPEGGETVILAGAGFEKETKVYFGGQRASETTYVDAGEIRATVPGGTPGPAPITARTGNKKFPGELNFAYAKRPSLWFSAKEMIQLRKRSKQAPLLQYRQSLLQAAKTALNRKPTRGNINRNAYAVAWGYVLTGEDKYAEHLASIATAIAKRGKYRQWDSKFGTAAAFAYDLSAPHMSAEQRAIVQSYLMDALDYYVEAEARKDWFITNMSSTNPVTNSSPMLIALLFRDARSDSDDIVRAAKHHLNYYLDASFTPYSGPAESVSRGRQGLTDYLEAAYALARIGDDKSLWNRERMNNLHNVYETMIATPEKLFTFADMAGSLQGIAPCAEIGSRTGNSLLLWVADNLAASGGLKRAHGIGLGMMWRTTAIPAQNERPKLPIISVMPDLNWATMRSEPSMTSAMVLGVKGSDGPLTYHLPKDVGSYALYVHGEELIRDPGWGKSKPRQHSLPVIDGGGPDATGGFITDSWTNDKWRALVIDSTSAYLRWDVRRVRRTFLMHTGGTVVVLDDIVPAKNKSGKVKTHVQAAPEKINRDRSSVRIKGKKTGLTLRLFGPDVSIFPGRNMNPEKMKKTKRISAVYNASTARPLITVLKVDTREGKPNPIEARVEYSEDRIAVELGDGNRAQFRRSETGWAFVVPDSGGDKMLASPPPDRQPPVAHCARTENPPKIDGKLNDPVWEKAEVLTNFVIDQSWEEHPLADYQTEARFVYDEDKLYGSFRCYEPNLEGLPNPLAGPAQDVNRVARIKFYLDPGMEQEGNRRHVRTLTAAGKHLGHYGKGGDLGNPEMVLEGGREGEGKRTAWTVEFAIKWEDILHDPWHRLELEKVEPGTRMGLNIERFRVQEPSEHSMWSRCYSWPTAAPWRWGTLIFK